MFGGSRRILGAWTLQKWVLRQFAVVGDVMGDVVLVGWWWWWREGRVLRCFICVILTNRHAAQFAKLDERMIVMMDDVLAHDLPLLLRCGRAAD